MKKFLALFLILASVLTHASSITHKNCKLRIAQDFKTDKSSILHYSETINSLKKKKL